MIISMTGFGTATNINNNFANKNIFSDDYKQKR